MGQPSNEQQEGPEQPTYAAMRAAFERAARGCAVLDRTIEIAGREVGLRLAGQRIAAWIDPALDHLAEKPRGPAPRLTIHLFLRESEAAGSNGVGDSATAGRISTSADGRFLRQQVGGCAYLLDRRERQMAGSIGAVDEIPSWELVKPLSVPLTTWLNDEGLSVVHAGLVSRGGGALFAGPSGSGKSTCAFACAAGGFQFLGDDCIILDLTPSADAPSNCTGYSLYSTGALDGDHLEQFASPPLVQAAAGTASRGKKLIALNAAEQIQTIRKSSIRAIVLPRLTDEPHSVIRPAAKGDALRILAPSSIIKRAVPAGRTLSRLAALVNLVPSYWLDMSHNPADIPEAIAPLISA
jgi:hypothetical protein